MEIMKVVLADDDADDRLLFQEAIEEVKINTHLTLFKDGESLIKYLLDRDTTLPEIVFLDLKMPKKDGFQCLETIRSHSKLKDLVVAIYSTSSSEEDIEQTFIKGANIYINKPNRFKDLKQLIAKVMKINWQYHTSALNKDNFLLRI
ncbi:response regulator [uncultured Winogradskyella sp.]|uniref:response regulator n=1 Tax=uncultured Winogradskyella sp. TaxID=395353 RepID=UPI0035116505